MIKRLFRAILNFINPPHEVDRTKPARIPVIHTACGGQCGWYLRDGFRPGHCALSRDYERMDGSHPIKHEAFRETCPNCGKKILGRLEMRIVFPK